jgi:hypothetical protein
MAVNRLRRLRAGEQKAVAGNVGNFAEPDQTDQSDLSDSGNISDETALHMKHNRPISAHTLFICQQPRR